MATSTQMQGFSDLFRLIYTLELKESYYGLPLSLWLKALIGLKTNDLLRLALVSKTMHQMVSLVISNIASSAITRKYKIVSKNVTIDMIIASGNRMWTRFLPIRPVNAGLNVHSILNNIAMTRPEEHRSFRDLISMVAFTYHHSTISNAVKSGSDTVSLIFELINTRSLKPEKFAMARDIKNPICMKMMLFYAAVTNYTIFWELVYYYGFYETMTPTLMYNISLNSSCSRINIRDSLTSYINTKQIIPPDHLQKRAMDQLYGIEKLLLFIYTQPKQHDVMVYEAFAWARVISPAQPNPKRQKTS